MKGYPQKGTPIRNPNTAKQINIDDATTIGSVATIAVGPLLRDCRYSVINPDTKVSTAAITLMIGKSLFIYLCRTLSVTLSARSKR